MGAAVSGDMDIASVALGTTIYSVVNPDSTLDLAKYWNVSSSTSSATAVFHKLISTRLRISLSGPKWQTG